MAKHSPASFMKISKTKSYHGTPIMAMEEVIQDKNSWGSTKISIFNNSVPIGEYIRNYPSMGLDTFYPFKSASGQWYALYSPHYTALRVMKINDYSIEDWCGEEPSANGFCPGEIYIPRYTYIDECLYVDNEFETYNEFLSSVTDAFGSRISFTDFAFLAGCNWGDDSDFKLRYVDLKGVDDKRIDVLDKFGYWPLPNNIPLSKCVTFIDDLDQMAISKSHFVSLQTNNPAI